MDKIDILRRTSLFGALKETGIIRLADICISRELEKKQVLFNEGDTGSAVFILVTGSVQLYKTAPDGRRIVIKVVKPGELFAEVVLFEQSCYPVNAIALTRGQVFAVPRDQFSELLQESTFRGDFLCSLMSKLRFLADQIQYLTSHDVEDRFFLFLEEQYGRGGTMVVNISKKDVAAAIGATPETLSRLLLRLKGEGKVDWIGRTVHIAPEVWGNR